MKSSKTFHCQNSFKIAMRLLLVITTNQSLKKLDYFPIILFFTSDYYIFKNLPRLMNCLATMMIDSKSKKE